MKLLIILVVYLLVTCAFYFKMYPPRKLVDDREAESGFIVASVAAALSVGALTLAVYSLVYVVQTVHDLLVGLTMLPYFAM